MINLADFVGTDAQVQVSSLEVLARQVYVSATGISNPTGVARMGDSTTAVNRGIPIPITQPPVILRTMTDAGGNVAPYSLRSMFLYIPGGQKVQIAYEPWD